MIETLTSLPLNGREGRPGFDDAGPAREPTDALTIARRSIMTEELASAGGHGFWAASERAMLVLLQSHDRRSCTFWINGRKTAVVACSPGDGALPAAVLPPAALPLAANDGNILTSVSPPHRAESGLIGLQSRPAIAVEAPYLFAADDRRLFDILLRKLLETFLPTASPPAVAIPERPKRDVAPQRGGLAPWQVRRVKDLLNANPESRISIAELAVACRLSRSHFARGFKVTMGQPPHRWLLQRRIDRAKQLITETNEKLADIAVTCEFSDQSHFNRIFSRLVGCSPGAWRQRYTT